MKSDVDMGGIFYEVAVINLKMGKDEIGKDYIEKRIQFLQNQPHQLFHSLYKFLLTLYTKPLCLHHLNHIFNQFHHITPYPYFQQLPLHSPQFYTQPPPIHHSLYFYHQILYPQKQIPTPHSFYHH
ncbi:hypothetical protein [Bacillus pumilus]|uniref:hypothetical protein n=1 Tax=Bacillus pumilus TaxID=1408 RepID=UPI0011A811EA|nr:hypothetical protein [Bacillus pumilus]